MSKTVLFTFSLVGFVLLTAADGDSAKGKEVFEGNCAECHDAYSKDRHVGPGLQGLGSGKLRDGRKATHDSVLDIINKGPGNMPAFQDHLKEQEKEDLVAFLLKL